MSEPRTPAENAERPENTAAEASAEPSVETPVEEIDLGTPPPRPGREARRFYGTHAQIRSALTFYRVMAFITGTFLLLMVAKILISGSLFGWVFFEGGQELYIGGTTASGEENTIGFFPAESLQDARSTSTLIAQAHGVAYIVYLIAGFRLWYLVRWGVGRLLLIISGGLIPFFSFFVERKIVGFVRRDLEAAPEAAPRY
ncbi:integral membrane protein [Nesterenkonia lacusekhoensis]|uniref:Integral membrane protein n=2 Tax=Nesterenkonia lacusekhoensis TaxID=150832 RepID=A0ABS4SZE0_9MICC|nr:integral membrane protein [Nesterenkonia lacusekhoensis]